MGGKGVRLRAKAEAPNWCKTMERKAMNERNGKGAGASGAKGRRFESCQAYQLHCDVLNTARLEPRK
jgi:hypothetical protein